MKLYIVGFGPGGFKYMTNEAVAVMQEADVIVGYSTYVELVKEHFPEKEFYQTPMKKRSISMQRGQRNLWSCRTNL